MMYVDGLCLLAVVCCVKPGRPKRRGGGGMAEAGAGDPTAASPLEARPRATGANPAASACLATGAATAPPSVWLQGIFSHFGWVQGHFGASSQRTPLRRRETPPEPGLAGEAYQKPRDCHRGPTSSLPVSQAFREAPTATWPKAELSSTHGKQVR